MNAELTADVRRVIDDTQQAISMLLGGACLSFGAPPDLIYECTEAEALDALREAHINLMGLLRADAYVRAGLGGAS